MTLPTTGGSSGYVLSTDGAGITTWIAPTAGTPGTPTTSVQYNNAGAFAGSANFTFVPSPDISTTSTSLSLAPTFTGTGTNLYALTVAGTGGTATNNVAINVPTLTTGTNKYVLKGGRGQFAIQDPGATKANTGAVFYNGGQTAQNYEIRFGQTVSDTDDPLGYFDLWVHDDVSASYPWAVDGHHQAAFRGSKIVVNGHSGDFYGVHGTVGAGGGAANATPISTGTGVFGEGDFSGAISGAGAISALGGVDGLGLTSSVASASGTVTTLYGVKGRTLGGSATAHVTNAIGLWVPSASEGGSVWTNNYGVKIDDQSASGSAFNYNLYSTGGTAVNVFEGPLHLGTSGALASLVFHGNSSGAVTLQPAAMAGSWSMTLPTTAGATGDIVLNTGSGVTKWSSTKTSLEFIIDGGGSAITTGIKGDLYIPFDCTITAATLLADQSGSIVVDIWKDTYANYPPTGADAITASAKPTITTATKSTDATLTGWTVTVTAGDTLRFNVDSITTLTRATLALDVIRR